MALTAADVENTTIDQIQNSTPTDWSRFNQQTDANDWDANRFAGDNKLYVRFYMKPRLNIEKSTAANRPIYEDTEYCEIMTPGEKLSILQRPIDGANPPDNVRFPKHYELFKQGQKEQEVGTPLKVAPFLTESQVEELAYFKIRTIEQLANMSDSVMQNFMGAREYQQKATQFLTKLTSGDELLKRNQELEARLAALEAKLERTQDVKQRQAEGNKPLEDILS